MCMLNRVYTSENVCVIENEYTLEKRKIPLIKTKYDGKNKKLRVKI